jgi:hydroxymethylpyrimidine/phosphomethylpyrimidine kinase
MTKKKMDEGGIRIQTILTIAGFDPSSGAGITADLAVIAAHGFFGTSAITALTVQSTLGVSAMHVVAAPILDATLQCLAEDLPPAGVKVGMLGNRENVQVVVKFLHQLRTSGSGWTVPVVLDPVIRSSSGRELLSRAGLDLLRQELIPLVDWVTPNVAELSALTGVDIRVSEDMEVAIERLLAGHAGLAAVATGGHLDSAEDLVATPDGRRKWLRAEKIVSRATHGTGCAYSTALTCQLVAGNEPLQAARLAKDFVKGAILRAPVIGNGNGPMELLWPLRRGRAAGD